MSPQDDHLKQVILIRGDLEMPAGKLGVQTAHATEGITRHLLQTNPLTGGVYLLHNEEYLEWLNGPLRKKICLRVNSEDELIELYIRAKDMGLLCYLVTDAGLTVFQGSTKTCCAIGPARSSVLAPLTGHLGLY